jgi:hypothetical protein
MFLCSSLVSLVHILPSTSSLVNHVHFGSSTLFRMQSPHGIILETHPPIPMLIATKSCPDNQDTGD